ncbi:hypothetical protein BH160DRAFT_3540 [Burkholderia sp. H160]|nr:hypothetical protein BH160DRAFT_3540 [Burkholderia sp. H160]
MRMCILPKTWSALPSASNSEASHLAMPMPASQPGLRGIA